jgi:hypothetical protein
MQAPSELSTARRSVPAGVASSRDLLTRTEADLRQKPTVHKCRRLPKAGERIMHVNGGSAEVRDASGGR